jgi:hypothetical protein
MLARSVVARKKIRADKERRKITGWQDGQDRRFGDFHLSNIL